MKNDLRIFYNKGQKFNLVDGNSIEIHHMMRSCNLSVENEDDDNDICCQQRLAILKKFYAKMSGKAEPIFPTLRQI